MSDLDWAVFYDMTPRLLLPKPPTTPHAFVVPALPPLPIVVDESTVLASEGAPARADDSPTVRPPRKAAP